MRFIEKLRVQLQEHEGCELKPYLCLEGKTTIGYGRNLSDKGISQEAAESMLNEDMFDAINDSMNLLGETFDKLSDIRKCVVVDMMYNLGLPKFMEFKKFIAALHAKDWETAADEMVDSKWYIQVGKRSIELVRMISEGVYTK